MSKTLILALAASTLLGATAVSAQSIDLGPGGPSIDLRNERQRERDYRREQERRDMRRAERYERRGCRTVTVREETDDGRTIIRKRREC
jgi:Ni/Co efflux regulator RcnB